MADHSSKKKKRFKKGKLIVIETYHEFRHRDAVRVIKNLLKDIKENKNVTAVVVCVEVAGGGYNITSSFSDDRPRLGGALINMGLVKMGYIPKLRND